MRAAVHLSSHPILARCLALLLAGLLAAAPASAQSSSSSTSSPSSTPAKSKTKKTTKSTAGSKKSSRHGSRASQIARAHHIHRAFVASAELRPMAQQLATLRSAAAYTGVSNYAHRHTGEGAAAAYLALGHAYLLDHRFPDAIDNLRLARKAGDALADYQDFLEAQVDHDAGDNAGAEKLLHGFNTRYPDSAFYNQAPELEANVLLALNDAAGAQKALAGDDESTDRPTYELAKAQIAQSLGQADEAERLYRHLLLTHPLAGEAQVARAKLTAMGGETTLSTAELRSLGDAYYNAGHYEDASQQYRALSRATGVDATARAGFEIAAAACDLKLKRLSLSQAEALPQMHDESGARRLYLLMELARNRNDLPEQQRIVTELETSYPNSQWLAEALFSSANMYMLRRDYNPAVAYYSYLATHFPESKNAAAAHWRAGWLSYRQNQYGDASRLFDEQIKLYPTDSETAAALYWRGRLYEMQDQKPASAAANYRTVIRVYQHYFYAHEFLAAGRRDAVDMAVHDLARESIDGDVDGLAFAHIGELRFLVIGHHIGALDRYHRHQLRAGLYELAEAQRAVSDHAVDRCCNGGVAEIEFGLIFDGFGVGRGRLGLDDLGVEQVDLLQGRSEIGVVARQRRVGRGDARLRLLRVLHAARSGRGQIGIAPAVLRGERHIRLVDHDRRLGGVDHGLLNLKLGLLAGDLCLGGPDIGSGLLERDPVVAVVDPRQHLARLDALIVLDQHLLKIARDLRCDGGAVGLDVGVVGGDQILADGPVIPAIPARAGQHRHRRSRQ